MNCVKELRLKKGVQQKELAISLGVSQAAVSDWEKNKKNPKGENLKKLAEYFGVSEDVILGRGIIDLGSSMISMDSIKSKSVSETEQIVNYVLQRLNDQQPKTPEAQILSRAVDRLPKAQREQALNIFKAVFTEYAEYFEKGAADDDT